VNPATCSWAAVGSVAMLTAATVALLPSTVDLKECIPAAAMVEEQQADYLRRSKVSQT